MSAVNEVEQRGNVMENTLELNKKTKAELITMIEELNDRNKQDDRQRQWGQQFDIWLIRAAKRERVIDFYSSSPYPVAGNFQDTTKITGIPRRVDKYMIQVCLEDGREVWISKRYMMACHNSNSDFQLDKPQLPAETV